MIQMEMPDGMNRASDFMNCTDDFFPLARGSASCS